MCCRFTHESKLGSCKVVCCIHNSSKVQLQEAQRQSNWRSAQQYNCQRVAAKTGDMSGSVTSNAEDYTPSAATLELFERYCSIGRDEVIQRVREAHQAGVTGGFPFGCILQQFRFVEPRISHHPLFQTKLLQPTSSDDAKVRNRSFLDIGCCMGSDVRYLLSTGAWTAAQVLGVDLRQPFLDIGMDILYKDRDKMESSFIVGNVLDDQSPMWNDARMEGRRFDVVYAGSVLYLLLEDDVEKMVSTVSTRLLKTRRYFLWTYWWLEGAHTEGHLHCSEDGRCGFIYPPSALRRLLEKHGLQDVEVVENVTETNLPITDKQIIMMNFHATKPS